VDGLMLMWINKMKKLLLLCLFVLCGSLLNADTTVVVGVPASFGIPACVGYIGGKTDTGGSEGSTNGLLGASFTHSAATCTVNTIEHYTKYVSGSATIKIGIYDDDAGDTEPLNLLASLATPTATGAAYSWVGGALDATVTLTNGNTYWIVAIADANRNYRYDTVSNTLAEECGGACTYAENMTDPYEDGSAGPYTRALAARVSSQ
jgi:hypothetical protein